MIKRLLSLLAALCLTASCAAADDLSEALDRRLKSNGAVGAAILIARDGEPVFTHTYGFREASRKHPVTLDTCFRIASVTKLVTAIGVLKLCEG